MLLQKYYSESGNSEAESDILPGGFGHGVFEILRRASVRYLVVH